eukprot:7848879-Pyramimonas_sp.AAC.1
MAGRPRARKADLDEAVAHRIFSEHIPAAKCSPTALWNITRITKNSLTSEWKMLKENLQIMIAILEETNGLVPKQTSLRDCFISWLADNGFKWSWKDADQRVYRLRVMLMTMQSYKTNKKPAP